MNFSEKFQNLNKSYKTKCIFKIGDSQGFFSEFNNMIYALVYCMEHKIQFILTDNNANFANWSQKPYEEYFVPFCKINRDKIHKKYNFRFPAKLKKSKMFKIWLYKKLHGIQYFTQDIFEKFYPSYYNKQINIPEMQIYGTISEGGGRLLRPFAQMVWQFNTETQEKININLNNLKLPKNYIAIQIRRGDKVTIYNSITPTAQEYMSVIKNLTDLKDILVLSDEYNDIKYLVDNYPEYKFYTFCKETDHGYSNATYQQLDKNQKETKLLELLATVDAMTRAQLFIGTKIANPQLFVRMILEENKCHFIEDFYSQKDTTKI